MLEIILPSFYLLLFAFLIWKIPFFHIEGYHKLQIILLFFLKVAFAGFLWWIYTYYYGKESGADLFKYFDDGRNLQQACNAQFNCVIQIVSGIIWEEEHIREVLRQSQHWYRQENFGLFNDNRSIIKINLLIIYFSNGIFHVHSIFFAFFSMLGSVALYHFAKKYVTQKKLLFFAIFLIPSVLFWASAALKESWLICILGLFLWQYHKLLNKRSLSNYLTVLIFGFLLLFIKTYVLLSLIPALLFLSLNKIFPRKPIRLFILLHLSIFSLFLSINQFSDLHFFENLQSKQDSLNEVKRLSEVGSSIDISKVDSFWNAFKSIPQALGNTFFEPWIHQSKNILQFFSAIENLVFLILMILSIIFFKLPKGEGLLIFLFSLSFVILLALIIGWTTPISGAIVRYKVPLLPFLGIILIQLTNFDKIKNLLKLNDNKN